MRRQRSDDIDEHDQPTEPALPVVLPPVSPTIPYGVPTVANEHTPVPQPHDHPFPYQDVPYGDSPYAASATPGYPVLPPTPYNGNDRRPPGGAAPGYPVGSDTARGNANTPMPRTRRSSLPLLVGIFFVLVQLLLLTRFVLILLAFPASTTWVGTIYTFSSIFVLPFRLLLLSFAPALPSSIELYTLLAILIYGLLSRILVRFLKALLH